MNSIKDSFTTIGADRGSTNRGEKGGVLATDKNR